MLVNHALKAIGFARYRAFDEPQRFELRPLTLLFGHNSVGKSAALRLLPTLASACRVSTESRVSSVLDYDSPALREAVLKDLIYDGKPGGSLQLSIHWDDIDYSVTLRDIDLDGDIISDIKLRIGNDDFKGGPPLYGPKNVLDLHSGSLEEFMSWSFAGIRPISTTSTSPTHHFARLERRLYEFGTSVHWLGAVRAAVPRFFELKPGVSTTIRHDGSGVAEALWQSAVVNDGAADSVSRWLKSTCDCTLSFAATTEMALRHRRLYPFDVINKNESRVAVRDVGEGIAQALPVVTLCHQARLGQLGSDPILAFEQPELHLHPAAAVKLADEIMSCIEQGSKALHVVETHAESMLLSVQIAIVERRIKAQDVVVYWVSQGENGSTLRPITFDDEGYAVGGWPQGVFRETLEQARRLSTVRSQLGDAQ